MKLYRGGTDESTFGPHLTMKNNTITNTGKGKRNKSNASLFLHGVQVTNIDENAFDQSAGITVEHTVGEPITRIINNQFINTKAPSVVELRTQGEHTATLKNNQQLTQ